MATKIASIERIIFSGIKLSDIGQRADYTRAAHTELP
jgi:hypothetical protein